MDLQPFDIPATFEGEHEHNEMRTLFDDGERSFDSVTGLEHLHEVLKSFGSEQLTERHVRIINICSEFAVAGLPVAARPIIGSESMTEPSLACESVGEKISGFFKGVADMFSNIIKRGSNFFKKVLFGFRSERTQLEKLFTLVAEAKKDTAVAEYKAAKFVHNNEPIRSSDELLRLRTEELTYAQSVSKTTLELGEGLFHDIIKKLAITVADDSEPENELKRLHTEFRGFVEKAIRTAKMQRTGTDVHNTPPVIGSDEGVSFVYRPADSIKETLENFKVHKSGKGNFVEPSGTVSFEFNRDKVREYLSHAMKVLDDCSRNVDIAENYWERYETVSERVMEQHSITVREPVVQYNPNTNTHTARIDQYRVGDTRTSYTKTVTQLAMKMTSLIVDMVWFAYTICRGRETNRILHKALLEMK